MDMLTYTKMILEKVSFDERLFKKELRKSYRWLSYQEISRLEDWAFNAYGDLYGGIISETFDKKEEEITAEKKFRLKVAV